MMQKGCTEGDPSFLSAAMGYRLLLTCGCHGGLTRVLGLPSGSRWQADAVESGQGALDSLGATLSAADGQVFIRRR